MLNDQTLVLLTCLTDEKLAMSAPRVVPRFASWLSLSPDYGTEGWVFREKVWLPCIPVSVRSNHAAIVPNPGKILGLRSIPNPEIK